MSDPIRRFSVHVSDEALTDLRTRLAQTRWPDQVGADWAYGTPVGYLQSLCMYWRNGFDWRAQEAKLNDFDHFTTDIDGERLHFIHQRSAEPDARPLLLSHGWPGSISSSFTGARCPRAATSLRSKCHGCWSTMCGSRFARCTDGRPVRQ